MTARSLRKRIRESLIRLAPQLFVRLFTSSSAELGLAGETVAGRHARRAGDRVLGRRLRTRHGELDLVVRAGDGSLVAIEVKSGRGRKQGPPPGPHAGVWSPRDHLKPAQVRRLRRSLASLAVYLEVPMDRLRVDCVEVIFHPSGRASVVRFEVLD